MSWKNRVIWSEGLFLQPHHFQQHDRYLESYVEGRCRPLRSASWGFTELQLDTDQLAIGKVAVAKARGVFPDGTPFNIPEDDRPPAPVDLDESMNNFRIFLALPTRRLGEREADSGDQMEGLARYVPRELEVQDSSSEAQNVALMHVGSLRTRLLLEKDHREEYACMGVAHVLEVKADRSVLLQQSYIPPLLSCAASPVLSGEISNLQGLLHTKADELAGFVSGRGSTAADIADFLKLQILNRYEPLLIHLASLSDLHPEALYRWLVSMAGEVATFDEARRPRELPAYRHDDLKATFEPVFDVLRDFVSRGDGARRVERIPLKDPRYGIRAAPLADKTLLGAADFLLAVRANKLADELVTQFPAQTKVGSIENIRDLVQGQLPGIPLRVLASPPPQIPYHADFVYFRLEPAGDSWPDPAQSAGFAIHIGAEFPGLDLQFWAIRK